MSDSSKPWLQLIRAPGVGSKTLLPVLLEAGSAERLLQNASLQPEKLRTALQQTDSSRIEQDLAWLEQADNHLLTILDPEYPELLKSIDDPPLALFIHGNAALLHQPQIAIVGSRNPSRNGGDNAFAFARHLGEHGFTITSGLASGVDGKAHEGALAGNAGTIAVTATGLDRVYPAHHRQLAHKIAEQGAIVSEFPPGTAPRPGHFPRRNRIISGLSLGTLVVEAAINSGSLITARLAGEQGREIFAIPGSIHNALSKGCHHLIKQGAKLVETAEDIVIELGSLLDNLHETARQTLPDEKPAENENPAKPDAEYQTLLDCLDWDPQSFNSLVEASGLPAQELSSMLLLLELQGHVSSAPGGLYTRSVPDVP